MKTALITGASSEMGLSIAKSLEGRYRLILVVNTNDLGYKFSNAEIIKCDFNNEDSVNEFINRIKEKYNKIDLIINVAARSIDYNVDEIEKKEFLDVLNVNTIIPFILIKDLLNKKGGVAINISSTDGVDTYNEYNLMYATSKAALNHLTKQLSYIYKDAYIYALILNYVNTKTTKSMNQLFLNSELKRIKQIKLIDISEICNEINRLLAIKPKSGTMVRMDG